MNEVSRLRTRWYITGWLLLVLVLLAIALGRGPVFDSSILALLPESRHQPLVQDASQELAEEFSHRLIVLVSASNDDDARSVVANLASEFASLDVVAKVLWQVDDDAVKRMRSELYPFRFQLLDIATRQHLQQGNSGLLRDRALVKLFAPLSAGSSALIDDPFALHAEFLRHLGGRLNLDLVQGMLKLRDSELPTYLFELRLSGDPFSPRVQDMILETIESARARLAGQAGSIQMSGMLIHAAAGASQAKREISTIGVGSLAGILIVMLFIFGRGKPLMLVLIPVAIGCLFASAVVLLIFGRVHLVTFAFGAGLVGVSIDYALHFLCERRYSSPDQALTNILPGLALGLLSSALAYATMLFTPFPGLRQMATFSVAGLFAAWVTVILCLPGLTARDHRQAIPMAQKLYRLRQGFPRLAASPGLSIGLALIGAGALGLIWNSNARDDVRLLQTSPAELILQEQEVQRKLGGVGSAQFILVHGASLEECLQIEESLAARLRPLVSAGVIDGFTAVSDRLPSLNRQRENYRLINSLYDQQLEALYQVLQLDGSYVDRAYRVLRESDQAWLVEETWQDLESSGNRSDLIMHRAPDSVATMIRFKGHIDTEARTLLLAMVEDEAAATYVDRIDNLSAILKDYRGQIQTWIFLAYAIVLIILLLRYRRQVWRIVLPPILASVLTLAALVQLEQGINLFHLIALILVLGIGLDMGIFMQETGGAAPTWLAVSLSALTSLLAFGLLALSKTPVLHHFGVTVAIGLSLVWLLSPLVRDGPPESAT